MIIPNYDLIPYTICMTLPLSANSQKEDTSSLTSANLASANKTNQCLYCGNNPVNHKMMWLNETLSILMEPLTSVSARSEVYNFLHRLLDKIIDPIIWPLLETLGFAKRGDSPTDAPNHRGQVLWEEADKRYIPFWNWYLFGKPLDTYEAQVNGRRIFFQGLPRLITISAAQAWIDDKAILKKKLLAAGLPTAKGGSFTNFSKVLAAFQKLDKPVIIKPRTGSRGRHTTTNIHTEIELKKAFQVAKQLCYFVVMEEHLVGSVYRATIIDKKLVGILGGDPPRITGDGIHNISELIEIKNDKRSDLISAVKVTSAVEKFLERQKLSLSSILPNGKTIDVLEKIGVSYGGSSAEVTLQTHPKIKEIMVEAGQLIDEPIIGFDFIIEHIDQDPSKQKWGIIECNSLPFINLHHDPIEGVPINAAGFVWDYVERVLGEK